MWSVLCVNLTELASANTDLNTILSVCGVFMGEIDIWRGRLSKVVRPSICGWAAANLWGTWREWKTAEEDSLSVFKLGHRSLLHWTGTYTASSPGFQVLNSHRTYSTTLLGLQRSWIFWVSRLYESIPYNKYNNIYPVSSVSLENPDSKIANLYWLLHRKHELLYFKALAFDNFFKLSHLHHTKTTG